MGTSGSPGYRARQRERERQRRQQTEQTTPKARSNPAAADVHGPERRTAATTCGWCGGPITPGSRGPIPKWCSATCRHRAWEQTRAAASGRAAVHVVERQVEVRVPAAPTRRDWARLLTELTRQLDDGRVYDRDLGALSSELRSLLEAFRRLPVAGSPRSGRSTTSSHGESAASVVSTVPDTHRHGSVISRRSVRMSRS